MAKSKTKELERLNKLYRAGDISEDEFKSMRKELMSSSKDDGSGCLGLIVIGIIVAAVWYFYF